MDDIARTLIFFCVGAAGGVIGCSIHAARERKKAETLAAGRALYAYIDAAMMRESSAAGDDYEARLRCLEGRHAAVDNLCDIATAAGLRAVDVLTKEV